MDLPFILAEWFGLITPGMQQAAITGALQMLGVFVTGMIALVTFYLTHRNTRRRDERLHLSAIERDRLAREEKVQDIQTALLADIRTYPHRAAGAALDSHLDQILLQIEEALPDDPFTPFIPRETPTLLWTLVANEVHLLPTGVIDSVVLFYSQLGTIELFADDLRTDRYVKLSKTRKAAMYRDYIILKKHADQLAADAEYALRSALRISPLNTPELDRSDPKSASASEAVAKDVEGTAA